MTTQAGVGGGENRYRSERDAKRIAAEGLPAGKGRSPRWLELVQMVRRPTARLIRGRSCQRDRLQPNLP
jgi:hypothetical protein